MLVPETYSAALCLMILTMLCWGSWANTLKLCPGYRFQLFYWDYTIGMALGAFFWGLTAGSLGHTGLSFLSDLKQTTTGPMINAMVGGAIFNVANLLLVAAIDVAGLAVAFPVGIGLALVFYFVTILANTLKSRPALFPEAILWSPNLFFEFLGLWLLWRVTRA